MNEEERNRYLGLLVEQLYSDLQAIAESTLPKKRERAAKLIYGFYEKHKEDYKIKNIEEIMKEIDTINENMKKAGKETNIKSIYNKEFDNR